MASTDNNKQGNKWSEAEDAVLFESARLNDGVPDYKAVSESLERRTFKQAKERWENTLDPDIAHGTWNLKQQLRLLECLAMPEFYTGDSLSWKKLTHLFSNRSRNSIKKKARTLLGEKVSKRCQKSAKQTAKEWTQNERELLMLLHSAFKNDFEEICFALRTGRAAAQVERELIRTCKCGPCKSQSDEIAQSGYSFKKGWTIRKASVVHMALEKPLDQSRDGSVRPMAKSSPGLESRNVKKAVGKVLGKRKSESGTETIQKPIESTEFNEAWSFLSQAATAGPNLAQDILSQTVSNSLGLDLLAGLAKSTSEHASSLMTPAVLYMMSSPSLKDSITKDPRFSREFILPSEAECQFDPNKPVGTTVRDVQTLKLLYVCPYHLELFKFDPRNTAPLENAWSKVQVYYSSTLTIPILHAKGEVWIRCLEQKLHGTDVVLLQHYTLISKDLLLCRYQDVTEKFPHFRDLPPPLFG